MVRELGSKRRETVGPYLPWVQENCEDLPLVREDRGERTSGGPVVAPAAVQGSYVRNG